MKINFGVNNDGSFVLRFIYGGYALKITLKVEVTQETVVQAVA